MKQLWDAQELAEQWSLSWTLSLNRTKKYYKPPAHLPKVLISSFVRGDSQSLPNSVSS